MKPGDLVELCISISLGGLCIDRREGFMHLDHGTINVGPGSGTFMIVSMIHRNTIIFHDDIITYVLFAGAGGLGWFATFNIDVVLRRLA